MSVVINPLRTPGIYDKIEVAGVENPGLFVLASGGSRPYKWDRKNPAGSQGATSTYRGWDVSTGIKAKFVLWTEAQIDEFFEVFLPLLQYDATKQAPKPVDVLHPVLLQNGIIAVQVDEIGPLVDEGRQQWSVTVEMSEFSPAPKKNATATPNSAQGAPNGAKDTKPSIEDRIDAEIEKELNMGRRPLPS